jgi:hypothetical protein
LHSATRRRSPPDSTLTSASAAGAQRVHRLLDLAVELPGVGRLDLVEQRRLLLEDLLEVGVRSAHLLVELLVAQDDVADALDPVLDVLQHVLGLVELRLLHQDADAEARRELRVAVGRLVQPGHHLQHRGLARAVRAQHADLRPRVEGERHVVEDDLVADCLADLLHRVDELSHDLETTGARGRRSGLQSASDRR